MNRLSSAFFTLLASAWFLLASAWFLLAPATGASAQRAAAIPRLDLDKLTGTWYELAKLPVKDEKKCVSDGTILYALNDKRDTLQIGRFCTVKGGDQDSRTSTGKMNKAQNGKLRVNRLVVLSRPYWVLAVDPNYNWALVGTPNHKSLWILSRQTALPTVTYNELQGTAAAQGFPVEKLVPVTHPVNRVTLASPSASPSQIETPAPTPTATIGSHSPGA